MTFDDILDADDFDDGYNHSPTPRGAGAAVDADTNVYRIEMPDGCGPWCNGPHTRSWADKLENWGCADLAFVNNEQMGVTEAAFRKAHGHGAYGCDSVDALKRWFPDPARKFLAKHGATVVVYAIPKGQPMLSVGSGEVVFSRPVCRRVETLDVVTLAPISAA